MNRQTMRNKTSLFSLSFCTYILIFFVMNDVQARPSRWKMFPKAFIKRAMNSFNRNSNHSHTTPRKKRIKTSLPSLRIKKPGRIQCSKLLQRESALAFLKSGVRLQKTIQGYIHKLHQCGYLLSFDKVRMSIYDYRRCKVVSLQEGVSTSAASLIKPFIMLAIYHQAWKKGTSPVRFPRKLQKHIEQMIQVSSNNSTNFLLRHLGKGSPLKGFMYIKKVLNHYKLKQTHVVELIPPRGKTYKNKTSARDLGILLAAIYRKRAVSRAYSQKMLQVMKGSRDNRTKTPFLRSNFNIKAATKTGYTKCTNGVAGIVLKGKYLRTHYQFVAMITRPLNDSNEWIWKKYSSTILKRFSEMTYHYFVSGQARQAMKKTTQNAYCLR